MRKIHDKSLLHRPRGTGNFHRNLKSNAVTFSDRYLSALIAQHLARSLRRWKVPGSNPTVGKNFHFVILGLRSSQVK